MSDSTDNSHLDGIISDFEALKRSFEVEEADASAHHSPLVRRTHNLRAPASSPAQRHLEPGGPRNSDPSGRPEGAFQRSPKPGLRRAERTPEPVSRRTEISIDISSKQADGSPGPAVSRFGLKRPEVLGHSKASEQAPRRPEPSLTRPQEAPPPPVRRPDTAVTSASRIPEPAHRKAEPASPGGEPQARVVRAPEAPAPAPAPAKPPVNSVAVTTGVSSAHLAHKAPALGSEIRVRSPDGSEVIPSYTSTMSEPAKPSPGPQPPVRSDKLGADFSYVGIDAILEQMRRKAMKQGFELNIMVVGQSGLGKSTLMNTLFKSKVSRKSVLTPEEERIPQTIEIKSISHDIEEKGVRMKLTVIDTPGFGDQINNEDCWQPIMKFINDQYEQYLQEEININRKKRIPDSRVHCCIYFIPPTGHSLRPLDVEFMRRLSKVVNIVPVIAKADTLTLEERDFFKKKIREELRTNGIDVYPQKEFDEDAEDRTINEKIREMIPFAVVGSDQEYQVNGRRLLGRKTKWGTIEVENIAHCEFSYLRDLLIRTHMQNIKDITSSIHYEVYRVRRLNESNAQANGVSEHDVSSHEL
ncbi:septin 9b isoform X2 [Anguilla anguilla]|uniref:septin 9b isoform X2 n=1 Tax=Anguilla anguilla TaxID=7936 RepID=UPI0015B35F53|nr:septin 9b isoform X2 [Anguilla anguilla]